ncbi:hypothetical protein ABZ690_34860 [Streptomyces sp. NPDC006967]|nr:hypothetical protein [Streptomyces sp. SM1]
MAERAFLHHLAAPSNPTNSPTLARTTASTACWGGVCGIAGAFT